MSANTAALASQPASSAASIPDNEVLRLLRARGSVRDFKSDDVPEALVNAVIAAGQRAPTSSNIQAYSIVVVRNQATKTELARLSGNQQHIIDCPVYFALCADLTRPAYACSLHGTEFEGYTFEKGLVGSIDAALVGMTMSLAADSLGLGTVMIGGMRNHPLEVAKLLKLPPRVYVVFGLCLGWPKSAPLPKPRQSMSAVVHRETFDASNYEQAIADYDRELGDYYRNQGRETPEQSWTLTVAKKFSVANRKQLRQHLQTLGFELE